MKQYSFDTATIKAANKVKVEVDTAVVSMNVITLLAIADLCRKPGYKDCLGAIRDAMGVYNSQYSYLNDCQEARETLAELDGALQRLASMVGEFESPYSYQGGTLVAPELSNQLERVEAKLDACFAQIMKYLEWCVAQEEKAESEEDDANW